MRIDWDKIEVRGTRTGVKKTICPNCSHTRKKKKEPCLYVNFDSGVAKCFNCDALGFSETREYETTKDYNLPSQEWQNYTKLSDAMVKYCADRKIRQETLITFGVTEEKQYQPARQKEMINLVFNYFEGDKLVNKKYRSGGKDFTQTKGGKPILYNINSVIGEDLVYIVEGEFDVLAMHEIGVKACVSIPNGANDNDDYWKNSHDYLKDVKRFVIATDNDEKGIIVRDKIAQRLGRYRCEFLEFEHKDANQELINGTLREAIKKVKRFPVSGTFTVSDCKEDLLNLYRNGLPDTIGVNSEDWRHFNDIFKVMKGHLVVATGIPSHGKSTFTENLVIRQVYDHSFKVSMFSPEHSPMELHQANLIQKATGKPFFADVDGVKRLTEADIDRYEQWSKEKIYLTSASEGKFPTWTWLLDTFKEQMFNFGIDVFVIDAFNKLGFEKGRNGKEAIDEVLTKLTMFAQMNHVLIYLIAHPTKMRKKEDGTYEMPTLYDVSGSSDFRNQTHDGFCIHRTFEREGQEGFTTFVNLKTKFSFQGKIGESLTFKYDKVSGRYYPYGMPIDRTDYTRQHELYEVTENKLEPNLDFDNLVMIEDEEMPF